MIDLDLREVRRGDSRDSLTDLEARLVRHLAGHPGRAWSVPELLVQVWDYHPNVESNTVSVAVQRLRAKIEEQPRKPKVLQNIRGSGYLWMGPGLPLSPSQASSGGPSPPARRSACRRRP